MLLKIWQSPRRLLAPHREREEYREGWREKERESTTATRRHIPKSNNFLRKCATCAECGLPLSLAHSTQRYISVSPCPSLSLSMWLQEVLIESILRCRLCHVANFAIAPKCMLQFCATKRTCGTTCNAASSCGMWRQVSGSTWHFTCQFAGLANRVSMEMCNTRTNALEHLQIKFCFRIFHSQTK